MIHRPTPRETQSITAGAYHRRMGGAGMRRNLRGPRGGGGGAVPGTDPSTLTGITSWYIHGDHNTKNETPDPDTMSAFLDQGVPDDDATHGTAANQPEWVGDGAPKGDGVDDHLDTAVSMNAQLDLDGYGFVFVIEPDGVQDAAVQMWDAPAMFTDSGNNVGLIVHGSGGENYLYTYHYDGGAKQTNPTGLAVGTSGKKVVAGGFNGTTIWCGYQASRVTAAAIALEGPVLGVMEMFKGVTTFFGGTIYRAYFYDAPKGTTDLDDAMTWLRATEGAT